MSEQVRVCVGVFVIVSHATLMLIQECVFQGNLKQIVYDALSYSCMRPKLLVYEA